MSARIGEEELPTIDELEAVPPKRREDADLLDQVMGDEDIYSQDQ